METLKEKYVYPIHDVFASELVKCGRIRSLRDNKTPLFSSVINMRSKESIIKHLYFNMGRG